MMSTGRSHLGVRPTCNLCSSAVAPNDSVVALLSNADSTLYNGHTEPFLFPAHGYQPLIIAHSERSEQYMICRFPKCMNCAKSVEAFTVHTDCLKIYKGTDKNIKHVWTRAAWKNPWRMSFRLEEHIRKGKVDSRMLLAVADGFGIPLLKMLPLEVLCIVEQFSETATLWRYLAVLSFAETIPKCHSVDHQDIRRIPISEVLGWERGSPIRMATGSQKLAQKQILRVCIDATGIRLLERVTALYKPSQKGCQEFIVEEARSFDDISGVLHDGLLRFTLPYIHNGFHLWDIPCPPSLSTCQFYPGQPAPPARFRTLDLKQVTGLTFFFHDGRLHGIHGHTRNLPSAVSTFQRFSERLQPLIIWIYFPLAYRESILNVRVVKKRRFKEYFDLQIFTTHKACHIGEWEPQGGLPIQLGQFSPELLLFEDPTFGRPISSIAVYCDNEYKTSEAVATLERPTSCPLKGEDIYYSYALLDDVVSVIVFNDPSNSLCKGVLLCYVDESQRTLGQCCINGTMEERRIDSPLRLCYQYVKSPRGLGIRIDFATQATKDLDWSGHIVQTMRGKAHYWFSRSSVVLCVGTQT